MRISVRSRRPWRMISCPAANGIRWVKPSSARVLPSCTYVAIASDRVRNSAIGAAPLQVEEHGFARALQDDVEGVAARAPSRPGQQRAAPLGGNTPQDRVGSG